MLVNNSAHFPHLTGWTQYGQKPCVQLECLSPEFRELRTLLPDLFSSLAFLLKLLKKGSQLLLPAVVISTCWYLATVLQVQQLVL